MDRSLFRSLARDQWLQVGFAWQVARSARRGILPCARSDAWLTIIGQGLIGQILIGQGLLARDCWPGTFSRATLAMRGGRSALKLAYVAGCHLFYVNASRRTTRA